MYLAEDVGQQDLERQRNPLPYREAMQEMERRMFDDYSRACAGITLLDDSQRPPMNPSDPVEFWEKVITWLPKLFDVKRAGEDRMRRGTLSKKEFDETMRWQWRHVYPANYKLGTLNQELAKARCALAKAQWRKQAARTPHASTVVSPTARLNYRPAIQRQLGSVYSSGLAEAAAARAGLKLLDHFHAPKKPDPTTPGAFVAGAFTKLTVANMNPGFIDAGDNLIVDNSSNGLQTCLHKLITTNFKNYLASPSSVGPAPGDRLRVALVDLTGSKLTRPDFAGWGSTTAMYGASVPKILAVYGAAQLRRDLRQLAINNKISNGKALEATAQGIWKLGSNAPNLVWLFDIRRWSGDPANINFSAAAKKALDGIMHNHEAGQLIVAVGFPYMGSLTWQSGLHHPTRGGLWLTSSYGKGKSGANPVRAPFSANVTALSVATYFTLLAQGRLTDDASSQDIKNSLRGGCVTGLFPLGSFVAAKCGIYGESLHDCALIERNGLRYVVVGLTKTRRADYAKYSQLFSDLDQLIVRNNQSPKPAC